MNKVAASVSGLLLCAMFSTSVFAATVHTEFFPPIIDNSAQVISGSGDGYSPIPYSSAAGRRVYFVNHHGSLSANIFGCADLDTGTTCSSSGGAVWPQRLPDGDPSSTLTSPSSGVPEEFMVVGSELYYAVTRFANNNQGSNPQDWGIGCYDLDTFQECGYTLLSSNPNGRDVTIGVEGPVQVGGRLYFLDVDMQLHCFDMVGMATCASMNLSGALPVITQARDPYKAGHIAGRVDSGKLYLTVSYNSSMMTTIPAGVDTKKALCVDTAAGPLAICSGWNPASAATFSAKEGDENLSNYFYYDTSSTPMNATHLCLRNATVQACLRLSDGLPDPRPDVASGMNLGSALGLGKEVTIGPSTYLPTMFGNRIFCVNWAGGTCVAPPALGSHDYGLALDLAGCMWVYGHDSRLWSFNPPNGDSPCRRNGFANVVTCPSDTGGAWDLFTVSGIVAADFADLVLEILDKNGTWQSYDLLSAATVNLSGALYNPLQMLNFRISFSPAVGVTSYTTVPLIEIQYNQPVPPVACTSVEDPIIFADGFESGDVSAWSVVIP